MAVQEIYVDPSLDASPQTGSGTLGDPYSDLEYAMRTGGFDEVNGTRFNIKAGTEEVLASELSAVAITELGWTPAGGQPLIFQGYTAAAGDGGKGKINCNGDWLWNETNTDDLTFMDLIIHNTGANGAINSDNSLYIAFCEFYDIGGYCGEGDFSIHAYQNYCHDVSGGFRAGNSLDAHENFIEMSAAASLACLSSSGTRSQCFYRNIMKPDNNRSAISCSNSKYDVRNNSIYGQNASTGAGMSYTSSGFQLNFACLNNVIEGFSGSGGDGIRDGSAVSGGIIFWWGYNSVYDCETAFDTALFTAALGPGEGEVLTSSPFADPINDDFAPNDVGSVKEGSEPTGIGAGYE